LKEAKEEEEEKDEKDDKETKDEKDEKSAPCLSTDSCLPSSLKLIAAGIA
jgi:hypothetical protein